MLIAFEGADCSGKSTLLDLSATWLQAQRGFADSVVSLHSPGETALGKELAKIVFGSNTPICKEAMRFLMAADAAQMHREIIDSALQAGKTVFVSRNRLSDYVYGKVAGIDFAFTVRLLELIPFCLSDITFLCCCPYKVAMQRKQQRDNTDRFESEESFFSRVWHTYSNIGVSQNDQALLKLVSKRPPVVLDTGRPIEDSMAVVKAVLAKELLRAG